VPDRVRYIAWLGLGHAGTPSPYLESLRTGLRELGWIEGRNLKIVAFWATGREDMEGVAREVLASDPDVVVTQELMAIAMRNLQSAKPVVFGFSGDPVDGKLVQSWARPAGNFTGMSYLAIELVGKRIELLKEWLPQIRRVAILARPQHPGAHAGEKPVASRLPLLPGGSGRKSLDRFFQFLRSAESDFLAGFNLNLLAGRGIAADAGCALAHLKNAKAANTNAFALLQMLHNIADQIAEHGLRLLLRHLVRFRERGGEMFKRDGRWCRSFSRNHCHQWDPPLESAGLAKRQTP